MAKHTAYRPIVDAHKAELAPSPMDKAPKRARFMRFMAASFCCSLIDQLLAAALFSLLRGPMAGLGFLRILVSNVTARVVSLTLNYTLNHRLVFTVDMDDEWQRSARRESMPRFAALSALVLALSTLGVYAAHRFFGIAEWQAKIACDVALFFLNYNVQRKWVFRHDITVSVPKHRR